MKGISTHVLDTAAGRPAAGVAIRLERREGTAWRPVGEGVTDADGRLANLLPAGGGPEPGVYRLIAGTGAYFAARGVEAFHPEVQIAFEVRARGEHHHVPLLVAPFGYTTYRGS